jgi:hypothetical protein
MKPGRLIDSLQEARIVLRIIHNEASFPLGDPSNNPFSNVQTKLFDVATHWTRCNGENKLFARLVDQEQAACFAP